MMLNLRETYCITTQINVDHIEDRVIVSNNPDWFKFLIPQVKFYFFFFFERLLTRIIMQI